MQDEHLTLRLSRALARALARRARERGVPKSQVARDAVGRYLAASDATPSSSPPPAPPQVHRLTAAELLARWESIPWLSATEAGELAVDLAAAREGLAPPGSPWG